MASIWTQVAFDAEVQNISIALATFTLKVTRLSKFKDQDAYRRQHQLMKLEICHECLEGYDVLCELLTDDEIKITMEQAWKIIQSCP